MRKSSSSKPDFILENALIKKLEKTSALSPSLEKFEGTKNITIMFLASDEKTRLTKEILSIIPNARIGNTIISAQNVDSNKVQKLSKIVGIGLIDEYLPAQTANNLTVGVIGANTT